VFVGLRQSLQQRLVEFPDRVPGDDRQGAPCLAPKAYDERIARTSSPQRTPRQARAGPGSIQQLPAGDEPVPKAA
jgi:hypothetical protein